VTGAAVFLVAQLAPLTIPLVMGSELSAGWKTALSTVLMLGVPELGILLGAAILGKEGFAWLKGKIFDVLRRGLPPDRVGPLRHRIGIVMFSLPLLMAWFFPYLWTVLGAPTEQPMCLNIAGDVLLVASLFVLGGDFWDKLRGLFLRNAIITVRRGDMTP
jgi:hypothetical protein